jgi:hypothetical protein
VVRVPPFRQQRDEGCGENHDRKSDIPGPGRRRMCHHWFRVGAIAGGSVAAGVDQCTEAEYRRGGDWDKDAPAISNGGHARSTSGLPDGVPDSACATPIETITARVRGGTLGPDGGDLVVPAYAGEHVDEFACFG